MLDSKPIASTWSPGLLFYVGLAVILLANMLPIGTAWSTFIHLWRVETAASIFLGATLIYVLVNLKRFSFANHINANEWKLIVLPIVVLIAWSFLSALWAPSWKSALHHSLIWSEYLLFYLIFRQILERDSSFNKLLTTLVVALVLYALPAVVEYCAFLYFGGGTTIGMRFAKYGEQVVTILPLVVLGVVRMRGKQFAIGCAAVGFLWLLVFCSLGRANYFLFGFAIAGVLAGLLISARHRRYVPKFALLVTFLILLPVPLHLFSSSPPDKVVPMMTRLNDTSGLSGSNNFRKLMFSVSTEMLQAKPLTGIGADNFGMQANNYREVYGSKNPTDSNLANAEDQIPAHAHNEFLQIAAELGLVGAALMIWLLAGIAVIAFHATRNVRSGHLYAFAAVLGLVMFLASSLVSAYSFRVMQNGIVFFFVLAVAAKLSLKSGAGASATEPAPLSGSQLKFALSAGILVCVGLLTYSGFRVSSVIVAHRANQTRPFRDAMPLYERALQLDDENPDVRQNLGMRLFQSRRYHEAIPHLQSAISTGRAPSAELSYLATAQSLAGDNAAAERTMSLAADLYPRSPFVLTRYAVVLEQNGKAADAAAVFARATEIDARAANTWRALMEQGPKAVTDRAARDAGYSHVMDLRPTSSIYAVVTERLIRFPDEQRYSYAKLPEVEE